MKKTVQEMLSDMRQAIQDNAINEIDVSLHVAVDMFIDSFDDYDLRKIKQSREREHSMNDWQLENEIMRGRII